jgi:dihydroxyacetone kinase-like protein
MEKSHLSLPETKEMFIHVSRGMVEAKDLLTQADKAIGDGDHGIGMARGFEAVERKLQGQEFSALDDLLKMVGTALLMSIGGAAGAVFGTLFRGGAERLAGQQVLDSEALAAMLSEGLQAVRQRGGAKPGDKTMVDALEPAAARARDLASLPLTESLASVTEAARLGMESTKEMIASVGKAKTLGERALGHSDPGAISMHLILKLMAEYVTGESDYLPMI